MKTAIQEIEWVVCPDEGGAVITPPSFLYAFVDTDAENSESLAAFEAWTIEALIPGCGGFASFSLEGDEATMAEL